MIQSGFVMKAAFGPGTIADGLACTQTTVPSMSVSVAPGSLMTQLTVDSTSFGTQPARTGEPLVKMGINTLATTIGPFTAPVTAGQSQAFLIQAQVSETDTTPVVLPYYNASNPIIPFSGPGNTGTAQNTQRIQRVLLQTKAGSPATTGSQVTPTADAGFVGLYQITIANGASTILNANIVVRPGAPFIPFKLGPGFFPGFGNLQVFNTPGTATFTVPNGVTRVKATVVGGGGGGSNSAATVVAPGANTSSGGGGGAGGMAVGLYTVTPGQTVTVTVGAGGTAQATGSTSSFGAFCSATGGGGTQFQTVNTSAGAGGGVGSGGQINRAGGFGSDGQGGSYTGMGNGAPGPWGGGGRAYAGGANPAPAAGQAPGAGAGGSYAATVGANIGGTGANGTVIIEW